MPCYTIADVFETLLRIQLVRGDLMAPRNGQSVKPAERTNPEGKPVSNILLLSIPDSEYQLVRPHLEFVELRSRATLHEPNQQIGFVYFPNGGVVSIIVAMADGNSTPQKSVLAAAWFPESFSRKRQSWHESSRAKCRNPYARRGKVAC